MASDQRRNEVRPPYMYNPQGVSVAALHEERTARFEASNPHDVGADSSVLCETALSACCTPRIFFMFLASGLAFTVIIWQGLDMRYPEHDGAYPASVILIRYLLYIVWMVEILLETRRFLQHVHPGWLQALLAVIIYVTSVAYFVLICVWDPDLRESRLGPVVKDAATYLFLLLVFISVEASPKGCCFGERKK